MSKFDLKSLLNSTSLQELNRVENKDKKVTKPNVTYISVHDLVPSEDNFYSMEQINELKTAIELVGGVKQNLIVVPIGNGKYKVIAGHRRCTASWELAVTEGKKEYEYLPCSVESTEEDAKLQALKEELLLILLNSQREKTEYDKVQEVERLKAVLEKYREEESIPGRTREIIAQLLNTSTSQVERREKIAKDLTPEFKQELKEQKVNASTAYEIAKLPQDEQKQIYQEYTDKGSLKAKDVQAKKVKAIVNPIQTKSEEVQEKEPEPVPFKRPLNIYVCCEYDGHYDEFKKAVESCEYVIAMGHIPFSASIMLHGFFQDDATERKIKGLQATAEIIRIIDEVWVFDSDGEITEDMKQVIDIAKQLGKEIMYRKEEHT